MIINSFLDPMKDMEQKILRYIECEGNIEEEFQNMVTMFSD